MMVSAVVLLAAVAIILALIWTQQRRMIYFPFSEVPAAGEISRGRIEQVRFHTVDGLELTAWFFPISGPAPRTTILVFNGNAGNRAYRVPLAEALNRRGLQVLLTDYRGYGGNAGAPTERGLAADSRAARAHLVRRPDVDPSRIAYFGESLGSAVAVDLAAEYPPSALILRSPFTSMADIGQHHYPFLPVRLLLRDRFASIERIRQTRAPLLVIAGGRDSIVPIEFSRRLYEAAAEPKQLVVLPDADHNDEELLSGADMIEAIVRFMEDKVS